MRRTGTRWAGIYGLPAKTYNKSRIFKRVAPMQAAKWGNSPAVRLPAERVRELGLKEGAQIDLVRDDGQVCQMACLWRTGSGS